MTLLVGQINEARQFVAFIPVATVLILAAFHDSEPGRLCDSPEVAGHGSPIK